MKVTTMKERKNGVCPQHFAAKSLDNWTPKRAQKCEVEVC